MAELFLLIAVAGLILFLALRWLLITTEGVFLGERVVVWLYDLTAAKYDAIKEFDEATESAFLTRPLRLRLRAWPSPLILDVATGTGRLPYFLLQEPDFHGRVVGLDASARMLAQAREKLRPWGDRAGLVRQSALALPFGDGMFDAVCCLEALEFLPDDAAALAEMGRVLKSGGVLLVTRRKGPEAGAFLHHCHTQEEFEALLSDVGMVEIRTQPWQVEYDLVWAQRRPDVSG